MKILKNKTYKEITARLEYLAKDNADLKERLIKAEDLKEILMKFSNSSINGISVLSGGTFEYKLPSNVAVYEKDILGGEVIKQEATKCLIVDTEGNIKTGITKQAPDKGYKYKLIRLTKYD